MAQFMQFGVDWSDHPQILSKIGVVMMVKNYEKRLLFFWPFCWNGQISKVSKTLAHNFSVMLTVIEWVLIKVPESQKMTLTGKIDFF